MFLNFFIFYLLCSSFFFSGFTFYKEALCFIIFMLSLCSNMLKLENILECIRQKLKKHAHFKISSQDEVFTRLFFLFFIPGWNFIPVFHPGASFIPGWNFTCKHPLNIKFLNSYMVYFILGTFFCLLTRWTL